MQTRGPSTLTVEQRPRAAGPAGLLVPWVWLLHEVAPFVARAKRILNVKLKESWKVGQRALRK